MKKHSEEPEDALRSPFQPKTRDRAAFSLKQQLEPKDGPQALHQAPAQ